MVLIPQFVSKPIPLDRRSTWLLRASLIFSLMLCSCESATKHDSKLITDELTLNDTRGDQDLSLDTSLHDAGGSELKDFGIKHDLSVKQADYSISSKKIDTQSVAKTELAQKKNPSTKAKKCRRGINKGKKQCKIKKGFITIYHINRGKKREHLRLIDDEQRIIPKAREVLLELLGDHRTKKQCKKGFSFNLEYKGRASWRMYDCYVQDRLLWYLYLVGHHFDSEIHIVSGLRSKERKTSRHHNGHAVDFRVPGVKAKEVWEYCKRTFPLTGVGFYPTTRFVHLDVGRDDHQAYWIDSSGSGESASYKGGVSQEQRGRARKSQAGMIRSIKNSLQRHYKSFTQKQKIHLERKAKREARKQRKKQRKRSKK